MTKFSLLIFLVLAVTVLYFVSTQTKSSGTSLQTNLPQEEHLAGGAAVALHSLSIETLRNGEYLGSDMTIEETLAPGSNYSRYIASYKSEGLKIYGLLTIPNGDPPEGGWPAIIFNHGYIPPAEYRSTERYIAYTDGFSRNDYVLFRPDYRGHGDSEGEPTGAYGSNAYTIDVLNAVASVKKLRDPETTRETSSGQGSGSIVNANRIGMWGHSLGGFITLRVMVVSRDVKAGVIWAGVVGSYPDLLNNWRRRSASPPPGIPSGTRRWRDALTEQFGTPEQNPTFWSSISANSYLSDISGPLSLHHGTGDTSVPVAFSEKLEEQMKAAGKDVELFTYPGDDHNLANYFGTAMQRSIEFFDKNLK